MLPERISLDLYRRSDQTAPWLRNLTMPIVLEHQERYLFAARLIGNSPVRVVDAASGSGWGTNHLANTTHAQQVIGIDFDGQVIEESASNFSQPGILFHKANLLDADSLKGIKDAQWIVSFETVEHFPEESGPIFLANLKDLMCPEGKLIVSTPNGPLFSPYQNIEGKPWYPYHYKEYNPQELVALLEAAGLKIDALYGQRFINSEVYLQMAKLLHPIRNFGNHLNLPWDHRLRRLPFSLLQRYAALVSSHQVERINHQSTQPLYLIALCSS